MKRERLVQKQGSGKVLKPGTFRFNESLGWWEYMEENKASTTWNLPEELVNKIQELEDELEVLLAINTDMPKQPLNDQPSFTYAIENLDAAGCGFFGDEELVIMAFLKSWGFSPEQILEYLAERFPQETQEEVDA